MLYKTEQDYKSLSRDASKKQKFNKLKLFLILFFVKWKIVIYVQFSL